MKALEKALNAYLNLDPDSQRHVLALHGKVVNIELLSVGMQLQLTFCENKIKLTRDGSQVADTIIKGTPLRLAWMAFSGSNRKQFFADDVSIQGDLDLGQEVIDLFDHIEIDWEEYASHLVGDIAAHNIGRVARKIKNWSQKTRETLLQNANEYLHEEINIFPPREALNDFFHDVDTLRMDVDRLEARVKKIARGVE